MDYYCFPTRTGDISVFFNLEQYTDSSERFFYQTTQENVMLAKQKGKLLLFDLRTQTFIDCNGNAIDIRGKEIFPRCQIQESEQLLNAIANNRGNSIVSRTDSKIVENWFEYIDVQRKFLRTTFGEVQNNLHFYEKKFGNEFFLKTVKKQFSNICHIIQMGDSKVLFSFVGHSLFGGNMLISDNLTPVLVTDALSIIKDDYGKREWRVFVVKGKIWCISRTSDDLVDIEPYIIEKIQRKIEQLSEKSIFPSSYCVDFFEYDNNGEVVFDICEFNPIECSGVYRNNNLVF
ncbi:MAG: hypothetical protein HFJ33_05180 [Clostridia bacterium]|nr:hypothetical protein [Clostridia bacterium]